MTSAWDNLPSDQKAAFYAKADPDSNLTGEDWFNHLVPQEIQNNPEQIEIFMNGGTVNTEVWTYDRGIGSGHYELVEYQLPDRDISRITSGANGGEYTPDNTIMEDASINRARGAENMTDLEYAEAVESNESAVDLIQNNVSTAITDISDTAEITMAEVTGSLLEGVVVATVAYKAGKLIADQCNSDADKIGFGVMGAGGTVLLYANPLTGPFMWGGTAIYSGYKLFKLGSKLVRKLA